MIKKPMTTAELFDRICEGLKEKGKWPDILDYASGVKKWDGVIELKTDEFELRNNLDYGGSEGIYLDFWIDYFDEEDKVNRFRLGTFKTLEDSAEAMHTMAALLADFILEEYQYKREHRADFNWKGTCLYPTDENGQEYGWGRYCYNEADVEKLKDEFLEKYPGVIIRNYETRKETVYEAEKINEQEINER